MSSFYLGQITMFGFGFAPKGWALCNGQTLAINQNQALFALLGTTYGGNGVTTFLLPNLQAALPVCEGQGAGLSGYVMGQVGGNANVTLLQNQLPSHNHTFNASKTGAASATVTGNIPATPTVSTPNPAYMYANQGSPALIFVTMAAGACGPAGSSQAHSNLMPSLTINFCIALTGIFPSRN
jgi:microcystin-dependent protein